MQLFAANNLIALASLPHVWGRNIQRDGPISPNVTTLAVTGFAAGSNFTIMDPKSVVGEASCFWSKTIPSNVYQPCQPPTFQYRINSRQDAAQIQMSVEHTVRIESFLNGQTQTNTFVQMCDLPALSPTPVDTGTGSTPDYVCESVPRVTAPPGWVGDLYLEGSHPSSISDADAGTRR